MKTFVDWSDLMTGYWKALSFGLIVVIGFLLLTSLVVSAAISYMGGQWFAGNEQVARMLELGASLVVMTGLFALTFKILPERRIPWGDVAFGAFVTAVGLGGLRRDRRPTGAFRSDAGPKLASAPAPKPSGGEP